MQLGRETIKSSSTQQNGVKVHRNSEKSCSARLRQQDIRNSCLKKQVRVFFFFKCSILLAPMTDYYLFVVFF